MSPVSGTVSILYVDGEATVAATTAERLEGENDRFVVETAGQASEGLDYLAEGEIDCVVSAYELPDANGIEFLEAVRERDPELPFVLFTDKGSEAVAGEAIAAGVTGYLRNSGTSEQYTQLAHRIENAIQQAWERRDWRRHHDAIETVQEGVSILDDEGRFVYVNDAYGELYGYEPEELVGKRWELLYPVADVQRIREEIRPQARQTGRWHGTTTGLRADGSTFIADHVLAPTDRGELVCTVRDITEHRIRERQLEAIVQATTREAIYLKDLDGRYQFINDAGARVFDRAPEDVIGQRAAELYDSVEEERLSVDLQVLENETAVEYEISRTVEGVERHFLAEKYPYYEGGKLAGLVGISRDITERKEYEREVQRQNERLEKFASVVSHDLRSPLNVAEGRLELARMECDSEHLAVVERAHERMGTLIEDLLALAREGETVTDREVVELAELVERCWANVDTGAVELVVDAAGTVRADRSRLGQLFENLIRNAIEHGGESTTVTVGDLPGGFYVEDDGSGIPARDREKVFEHGYTTTDEGTGFGLAIVAEIVEAHGWDISAVEGEAGGARFEITGIE